MSHRDVSTTSEPEQPARPEAEIVSRGEFLVAGLRYEGRNERGEIPALWDQFIPRAGEIVADPTRLEAYGVARALPAHPDGGTFEYLAGAEVASLEGLPEGMTGWRIPALTWAILPAHNIPDIGPVSDYFRREWLPQSKEYEPGEGLMIEYYPATFSEDLIIQLWFAVRRKERAS